jgi:hypothetical protein
MDITRAQQKNRVQVLHKFLFPLNLGFAFSFALFTFVTTWHSPAYAPEFIQKLLTSFGRFLLRIAPLEVSIPADVRRRSIFIWEFGFVCIMISVALIVLAFRRMLERTRIAQFILDPVAGITALLAVPGLWFYMIEITRPEPELRETFWSTYGILLPVEIGIGAILVFLVGKRLFWCGTGIFVAHCLLWGWVISRLSAPPTMTAIILAPIFPLSGIAWLWYTTMKPSARIRA